MIDYIIISKSLIPLVRSCVVVMDAPWGPHFGISLKLFGNLDDILVRVLVAPTLPKNYIELLKPKAKAKQEKVEDKSRRQKARDEDTAREMQTQSENKEEWCELFVATPLVEISFSEEDPLQKTMVEYAEAMGVPTRETLCRTTSADGDTPWLHMLKRKARSLPKQTATKRSTKAPRNMTHAFSEMHQRSRWNRQ